MTDRLTCHDMEMLCRQRAVLEGVDRVKWLDEAERWRALAYDEAATQFQKPAEQKDGLPEKRAWPSPL